MGALLLGRLSIQLSRMVWLQCVVPHRLGPCCHHDSVRVRGPAVASDAADVPRSVPLRLRLLATIPVQPRSSKLGVLDRACDAGSDQLGKSVRRYSWQRHEGSFPRDLVCRTIKDPKLRASALLTICHRCARTLGTLFGFLSFIWRYVNVPDNWSYVVNPWALALMSASILGDALYPVFFLRRKLKKEKTP